MGDAGDGDASEDDGGTDLDLTTTRDVWVTTPLADGVMALEAMEGQEMLGQQFSYELSLVSTNWELDLSTLLGVSMTVHLTLPAGGTRHFNGIVSRVTTADAEGRYARYIVTLQPW